MKKAEIEAVIKAHEAQIEKLKSMTPDDEITRDMGKKDTSKDFKYYYLDDSGKICNSHTNLGCIYLAHRDSYNFYLTHEEALKEAKFTKLSREYRAFAKAVNGDSKADWNDRNQIKWGIVFKEENLKVNHFYFSNYFIHQVHFKSKELAEKALELFSDDLLILAQP